jgi:hypothetical protein
MGSSCVLSGVRLNLANVEQFAPNEQPPLNNPGTIPVPDGNFLSLEDF